MGRAALSDRDPLASRSNETPQEAGRKEETPTLEEMVALRWLLLVAGARRAMTRCTSDESCSLNGVCEASGACRCDAGWRGDACGVLNLVAAPPGGAYGFSPNISSWGAHVVRRDGEYHMFVSEMWNGCGISSWKTNSHLVHATSRTPLGPYAYQDTSLPPFSHCNHVLESNGTIYLFHQGRSGDGNRTGLVNCSRGSNPPEVWPPAPSHARIHASPSPSGPWSGAWFGPNFDCENPSPLALENGSVALFCHGPGIRVALSKGPGEPWTEPVFILQAGASPRPHTVWEDPFAWIDANSHWHLLSHVYPTNTSSWDDYNDIVAGHAYSRDGVRWQFSDEPPYTATVKTEDGGADANYVYATRERPFLLFDEDTEAPIALFTSVTLPGRPKQEAQDYSFTHVQPVAP